MYTTFKISRQVGYKNNQEKCSFLIGVFSTTGKKQQSKFIRILLSYLFSLSLTFFYPRLSQLRASGISFLLGLHTSLFMCLDLSYNFMNLACESNLISLRLC